jgi:hypothetical protein
MRCEECGIDADDGARGWRAYLVDLYDDGEDDLAFYCPACAEREFSSTTPPDDDQ